MISIPLVFESTLLLLLGALLLGLTKKHNPALRHLLCCFTLLCCLAVRPVAMFTASQARGPILFSFSERAVAQTSRAFPLPLHWLNLMWIAGVVCILGRYIAGVLVLSWRTRQGAPFNSMDQTMHLALARRSVQVRVADVTTPMIWGWRHPTILLPSSAYTWPPERIHLALLHELAHVERRDLWTALIDLLAQALYWFHPLVWWFSARSTEEKERACDDKVLEAGVDVTAYAALLVDIARQHQSPALFGCAMVRTTYSLQGRIMYILQQRSYSRPRRTRIVGLLASFTLVAALWAFSPARSESRPGETGTVYKVGDGVLAPHIISKVQPSYPKDAKEPKVQGVVLLSVLVDKTGLPQEIAVVRTPDSSLGQAAIDAVQQWRFEPGTKSGEPVAVRAQIEINFQLRD